MVYKIKTKDKEHIQTTGFQYGIVLIYTSFSKKKDEKLDLLFFS